MKPIRKELQESLVEQGIDYILKTDEEIIEYLIDNGGGEYDFNAYDINRIIVENQRMKEKLGISEI